MMSDSTIRADFKEKISPHIEVLLQFSLWLTKNGRDAVKLMRSAMAEAVHNWDELTSEESYVRLHSILTRQFLNRNSQVVQPPNQTSGGVTSESVDNGDRLISAATGDTRHRSWLTGGYDGDVNYFEAFAGLPPTFRSVMILSYLEGFSNVEIADLAGVQPLAVDSLLNRGREFLREELFAHLVGENDHETIAGQSSASG